MVQRPKLLVAALSVLCFALTLSASLRKSPAFDEPFHLSSGLFYVQSGHIVRVPDHPPLARELSGLSLWVAGIRLPHTPETLAVLHGASGDLEYSVGNSIITENGPDHVMFWARMPFFFLGAGFIWAVYFLGRELAGEGAGVCAAFLCTFDPMVLSNFGLVYTDASLALFGTLTILALWRYVQCPSWPRILWCGLALGAALGSKYSAVALLPAIASLLFASRFWPVHRAAPAAIPSGMPRTDGNYAVAFTCMCAIAVSLLLYLFLWPDTPSFYLDGMHQVNRNHNPQWLYYLGGQYGKHFYRYYVEAWLLKEPIATVALTIAGIAALARSRESSRLARFFLFVPAAILLIGYSLYSDHLGVRYILPVIPFCMVAAGAGLMMLWQGKMWMRVAALVSVAWAIIAAIGVFPDHMNYFNESACLLTQPASIGFDGGTACGWKWLDDSNIDSAQSLKELHQWLARNANGRPIHFGYFGSFPPDVYGIPRGVNDSEIVHSGTQPGLYVVSAQMLARAHPGAGYQGGSWLLHAKPIAFVGHTYFVYNLP